MNLNDKTRDANDGRRSKRRASGLAVTRVYPIQHGDGWTVCNDFAPNEVWVHRRDGGYIASKRGGERSELVPSFMSAFRLAEAMALSFVPERYL
jgi:hypothetical protein